MMNMNSDNVGDLFSYYKDYLDRLEDNNIINNTTDHPWNFMTWWEEVYYPLTLEW